MEVVTGFAARSITFLTFVEKEFALLISYIFSTNRDLIADIRSGHCVID
jgi:hypothetical protein